MASSSIGLLLLLLCVGAQAQYTYTTFDVAVIDFGTPSCGHLVNRSLNYSLDLQVVYTKVKLITLNLAMLTNDEVRQAFVTNNVSAIIFGYNHKLAVVTSTEAMPYLMTGNNLNMVLPNNTFWIDQVNTDLAIATASLLNTVKASTRLIVIVSDHFQDLHIFTDTLVGLFISFDILQYYSAITDAELKNQLRLLKTPYTDTTAFIVLLANSEMENLTQIFNAAVDVGYMNLHQLWIIPSLNVPARLFDTVRHTKTRLVTFSLENEWASLTSQQSKEILCEDAVKQLMKSVATPRPVNDSVIQVMPNVSHYGTHGEFRYNQSRIRVGGNIVYKSPYSNIQRSFDSKLRTVGIWSSRTSRATINDTTISRKATVIRLGIVLDRPFFAKIHGSYVGYFASLMEWIAKKNNWILKWKIAEKYGTYNETTKIWGDGLMKMIVNNEVDIGVGYMLATKERKEAMDFSTPIMKFGYTTLARKPPRPILWFLFVYPFGLWVWIGLGIAFVIMSFTFFIVDRLSCLFLADESRKPYTLRESIFNIFITFSITKYPIRPITFSTRFFMIIMWFACLVIIASYVANFVPHLIRKETVPPSYRRFSTLINNTENYRWFFTAGDATTETLSKSEILLERQLVEKAKNLWPNEMYVSAPEAGKVMTADYKRVYITDQTHATYLAKQDCNFETGLDNINMQTGYMAYSKNFPFKKRVNDSLLSFTAMGVLDELYRVWVTFGQPCSKQWALQIEDVAVLFMVLGGGIVIGIIVGIIEVLRKACAICCLRLKLKKLEFGKLYNAEITCIEQDGVRVNVNGRPHRYFLHNSQLHPDPIKNETAQSLKLKEGSKFKVRYFGKDPINGSKYFVREARV